MRGGRLIIYILVLLAINAASYFFGWGIYLF